jgi:hypothetical protein
MQAINLVDLTGTIFQSPRHANPVDWVVLRYHRNGYWICQEQEHKTTCEFSDTEIGDYSFKR